MPLGSTSENITSESSSDTQNKATSKVSAVSCQWINLLLLLLLLN